MTNDTDTHTCDAACAAIDAFNRRLHYIAMTIAAAVPTIAIVTAMIATNH